MVGRRGLRCRRGRGFGEEFIFYPYSLQATLGSASPDWVDKNSHTIQDWVEDVEGDSRDLSQQYHREKEYDREFRDSEGREYDRPSRPNSRDSRVSKESRGSKESKGINL